MQSPLAVNENWLLGLYSNRLIILSALDIAILLYCSRICYRGTLNSI